MRDFVINNGVLERYTGRDEHVIIPEGVKSIGASAFYCCSTSRSVVVPNGVTSIGENAFLGSNLENIELPQSLTDIGECAFNGCYSLRNIVIPESVIRIGHDAFLWCDNLQHVILPECMTRIDKCMSSLEHYRNIKVFCAPGILPSEINADANFKFAMVYGFATYMSRYSEEKKQEYRKYMSSQKKRLLVRAVSDNVCSIFNAYEQLEIKIQPALRDELIEKANQEQKTEVQAWLMDYKNRTADRKKEAEDKERSEEQQLFTPYMAKFLKVDWAWSRLEDGTIQIDKYKGKNAEVMIPSCVGKVPVTAIGDNAFKDCIHLQSVMIPQGVTTIGKGAFYGCSKLESIDIPETVTKFGLAAFHQTSWLKAQPERVIINGVLVKYQGTDCEMAVPSNVTCIGAGVFERNETLQRIVLPEGITCIDDAAFYGCDIVSIVIPESVTTIGEDAFHSCYKLQNITIPESVTSIENGVFANCKRLKSIVIPEGVTNIGERAFYGCGGLQNITIPKSVTSIGDMAFYNCHSLVSIVIPEGVTRIGARAFSACKELQNITIPNSITEIKGRDFFETPWLKNQGEMVIVNGILIRYQGKDREFRIPTGVTCIGAGAFEDCHSLQNVVIPPTVTSINEFAFRGCKNLRKIEIPGNVNTIGWSAFCGCDNLQNVRIPGNIVRIDSTAFAYCKKLKSVVVSEGVMNFDEEVFSHCYNLNRIVIPKTVVSIGKKAFHRCNKLTIYAPAGSYAETYAKENDIPFVAESEKYEEKVTELEFNTESMGQVQDKVFVVTGSLKTFTNRKEFKACLDAHGAVLSETLNKETSYLITNTPDSGSAKNKKADQLGVKKLTEDEFNRMIGRIQK